MRPLIRFLAAAFLAGALGSASAAYIISLGTQGSPAYAIQPGESFDLDVILFSDLGETNNSAILRLEFSSPGLSTDRCEWFSPYGTANDDTKPKPPILLAANDLAGPHYPVNVVDIELSNATGASPGFTSGRLAKVTLSAPSNYNGPDLIRIRAVPDVIAYGFDEIPTRAEQDFWLAIVRPVPIGAPTLRIFKAGDHALITWLDDLDGYKLQSAERLDSDSWSAIDQVFSLGSRKIFFEQLLGLHFFQLTSHTRLE